MHHAPNPYVQGMRRQRNDSDNFSVDFEREALQRSQNAHVSNSGSTESLKAAAASSSNSTTTTSTKSGKRGWMSSILNSGSSSHQQPAYSHPQQQPLVVPPSFAAQQQQQQQAVINANAAAAAAAAVVASSASIRSGTTSLKRSPSERSVEVPAAASSSPSVPLDPKKAKKEAERLAKEAEKAKREAAQRAARDRARAVMQKRQALAQAADPLHNVGQHQMPGIVSNSAAKAQQQAAQLQREQDKEKQRMMLEAAARKQQIILNSKLPQIQEDGRYAHSLRRWERTKTDKCSAFCRLRNPQYPAHQQYQPDMRYKARRRDDDDDVHSMSSSETRSERRFSISSHATASTVSTTNTFDSDPGASRTGRPGASGGLLAPLRRSPSVASFGGQSHLSVGSQNSGHSYSSRRDLGTSGSNSSSLEFGLVGRFQGLTAAESDSRSASGAGSTSPTSAGGDSQHPSSPYYNHPTPHMPSHGQFAKHPGSAPGTGGHSHQQHSITLPPISSFDHPPPKEFSFPGSPAGSVPRTSQSQNSNNSTISGSSNFVSHNMYHQQQQQQHHSHHP
jgi:meiosis induction protein kinase IME2/SME1